MRATIYIRKENQEWWKEFGSSAWVNRAIVSYGKGNDPRPPEERIISELDYAKDRQIKSVIRSEGERVRSGTKPDKDTCPHGFSRSARLCKKGCR